MRSLNSRLRNELLLLEILTTLDGATSLMDRGRRHYNHCRIQREMKKLTQAAFAGTRTVLPRLRIAPLDYAAIPPDTQGADTMHPLSQGVDR